MSTPYVLKFSFAASRDSKQFQNFGIICNSENLSLKYAIGASILLYKILKYSFVSDTMVVNQYQPWYFFQSEMEILLLLK